MPRVNGLRATGKAIRETCPQVKVVTLTRHADDNYVQQLLRAGAAGYVLKQSRTSEVLRAIRAVAGGLTYIDPSLSRHVAGRMGTRMDARTGADRPS